MKIETPLWMYQGAGDAPENVMAFRAESPLTAFAPMLECGDFVLADELGTVYRLDPHLNVSLLTRIQGPVQQIAWDAVGEFGVALTRKNTLTGLNAKLKSLWSIELTFSCSTIAVDPYGNYVLVANADGGAALYSSAGRKRASLTTLRPLAFAGFLVLEPVLFAAAAQGLLAAYDMRGKTLWEERIWSNVSDFSLLHKDKQICLAAQNHGIKVHDQQGESIASLVVDGTVKRLAVSYSGRHIFAATAENQLYRIDHDGNLLWASRTPREVKFLSAHPVNNSGVVVYDDRTVQRLEW